MSSGKSSKKALSKNSPTLPFTTQWWSKSGLATESLHGLESIGVLHRTVPYIKLAQLVQVLSAGVASQKSRLSCGAQKCSTKTRKLISASDGRVDFSEIKAVPV